MGIFSGEGSTALIIALIVIIVVVIGVAIWMYRRDRMAREVEQTQVPFVLPPAPNPTQRAATPRSFTSSAASSVQPVMGTPAATPYSSIPRSASSSLFTDSSSRSSFASPTPVFQPRSSSAFLFGNRSAPSSNSSFARSTPSAISSPGTVASVGRSAPSIRTYTPASSNVLNATLV